MTGPTLVPTYLGPGDWVVKPGAFYDVRPCETCGDVRPLQVYALPGFPISVGHCFQCWWMNAYPLWLAEAQLEDAIERSELADWFLDSFTFKDGVYLSIRNLP